MQIYSIEIYNLGTTAMHSASPLPKGCLGVVVDKCKFDIYHELPGGVFYSECDGLLSIYHHVPGSTEGFGGRVMALPVMEPSVTFPRIKARRVKTFKGSLWSSAEAGRAVEKHLGTKITNIGVREHSDRLRVYYAAEATAEFLERVSRVVVLGKPECSPLL